MHIKREAINTKDYYAPVKEECFNGFEGFEEIAQTDINTEGDGPPCSSLVESEVSTCVDLICYLVELQLI